MATKNKEHPALAAVRESGATKVSGANQPVTTSTPTPTINPRSIAATT